MREKGNLNGLQQAWMEGLVCLHPTDTIPGLSFRPDSNLAWSRLRELKGRSAEQTCIALVPDLTVALRYWQELPAGWQEVLTKLWPAPLSVIWQSNELCPKFLQRDDGSLGLRVPRFHVDDCWMIELLKLIDQPFPTTSVNRKGEAAASHWGAAKAWLQSNGSDVAIPSWVREKTHHEPVEAKPSTLLKILGDIDEPKPYQMIREGSLSLVEIESTMEKVRHG
ncbi:MAG: L-threonylcarbamoyladenylate synthase [Oligoflexus sp.]